MPRPQSHEVVETGFDRRAHNGLSVGGCTDEQRNDHHPLPGLLPPCLPLKQGSQWQAGGGWGRTQLVTVSSELGEGRV